MSFGQCKYWFNQNLYFNSFFLLVICLTPWLHQLSFEFDAFLLQNFLLQNFCFKIFLPWFFWRSSCSCSKKKQKGNLKTLAHDNVLEVKSNEKFEEYSFLVLRCFLPFPQSSMWASRECFSRYVDLHFFPFSIFLLYFSSSNKDSVSNETDLIANNAYDEAYWSNINLISLNDLQNATVNLT